MIKTQKPADLQVLKKLFDGFMSNIISKPDLLDQCNRILHILLYGNESSGNIYNKGKIVSGRQSELTYKEKLFYLLAKQDKVAGSIPQWLFKVLP